MHAMNIVDGHVVRTRRVGMSVFDEQRLRRALRKKTPSEPWIDAQFIEVVEWDDRGGAIVRRAHDPKVFPPGGEKTRMLRCKICSIFNPPNAMENGACMDHHDGGNWGASPSAVAIEKLRYRFKDLEPLELASEVVEDLQVEIRAYMAAEKRRRQGRRKRGRPRKAVV